MQNDASATAAFMKVMRAVAFSDVMRTEFDDHARCLERIDTQQPLTTAHQLGQSTSNKTILMAN